MLLEFNLRGIEGGGFTPIPSCVLARQLGGHVNVPLCDTLEPSREFDARRLGHLGESACEDILERDVRLISLLLLGRHIPTSVGLIERVRRALRAIFLHSQSRRED